MCGSKLIELEFAEGKLAIDDRSHQTILVVSMFRRPNVDPKHVGRHSSPYVGVLLLGHAHMHV